ncbi:MFS transporter [Bacillus pretiosus]|uniref:MFS transporter n=1 Tax=Bacillus TaxID=1386 RepID=UPI003D66021A
MYTKTTIDIRKNRIPPIVWIWLGQGVSTLGTGVYATALAWEIIRVTGSALSMGLVLFISMIPKVIVSIYAGAFGDRFSKKKILLYADFVRAFLSIIWGITLFFHQLTIYEVYIFTLIFGIVSAFFSPVYSSIIPDLIKDSKISKAVATNSLVFNISNVCALAIGGVLISFFTFKIIIILNGLTFGIACIMNVLLPKTGVIPIKKKSIILDIKEGIRYFFQEKVLFWSVFLITLANIAVVSYQVNLAKYIQVYREWGAPTYGFILSVYTIGSIISFFTFSLITLRKYKGIIYITCLLIGGILFSFIPYTRAPWVLASVFFFIGASFSITSVISTTILYEYTNEIYRGRVFGIASLASLLNPIGFLVWGAVGDLTNNYIVFISASVIIISVSIIGYFTQLSRV